MIEVPDTADAADFTFASIATILASAATYSPPPPPPAGATTPAGVPFRIDMTAEAANDLAMAARMMFAHASELIIVRQPVVNAELQHYDVYQVDSNGMLSVPKAEASLKLTCLDYLELNLDVNTFETESGESKFNREYKPVLGFGKAVLNKGLPRLGFVWAPLLDLLDNPPNFSLPQGLVVVDVDEVDSHLQYMGTPKGVLDLFTGQILSPQAARQTFTIASIPDEYDPTAVHPWVEEILPPIALLVVDSIEEYRAKALAWMLTHKPQREFIDEQCEAGSGKTTYRNAISRGLGAEYIGSFRKEAFYVSTNSSGSASHNGDWRRFGKPCRLLFVSEFNTKGLSSQMKIDEENLKAATGGDPISFRQIREADEVITPTASLWIQGNVPPEGQDPLGLSGDSDESKAIRDRAKVLTRQRIPDAVQDKDVAGYGGGETPDELLFRQAVVARVVEYCIDYAQHPFPDDIPSVADALLKAKTRGVPLWKQQWMPSLLTEDAEGSLVWDSPSKSLVAPWDISPGEFSTEYRGNSYAAYELYKEWHEGNGEGKWPTQRAVTEAIESHYKITDAYKSAGKVNRFASDQKKGLRADSRFWHGFYFLNYFSDPTDTADNGSEAPTPPTDGGDGACYAELENPNFCTAHQRTFLDGISRCTGWGNRPSDTR